MAIENVGREYHGRDIHIINSIRCLRTNMRGVYINIPLLSLRPVELDEFHSKFNQMFLIEGGKRRGGGLNPEMPGKYASNPEITACISFNPGTHLNIVCTSLRQVNTQIPNLQGFNPEIPTLFSSIPESRVHISPGIPFLKDTNPES